MSANRIDVHFHTVPQVFRDAAAAAGKGATISSGFPEWSVASSLALMDRHDIATALLSLSQPGVHFGDDAAARQLARAVNDGLAEAMAQHPQRFGAFATLPMPDVEGACAEAIRTLDEAGFDGVCLLASYGERFLGDEAFEPLMQVLNERDAVVFVHPNYHPSSKAIGLPLPAFMMEFLFDTTRAAANLIFTRTLDRYPRIRFILAHAGGTLPYIGWRMAMSPLIDPRLAAFTPDDVLDRLGRFWYDTALSAGPAHFGALDAIARPERILFGSDWPYAPETVTRHTVAALEDSQRFTPERQREIARDNALALFPRLA